jgi:hypothetical protein
MCDPLTIAGIALSAGSAVANNAAASQQARAQASAMAAERTRQRMLDDEASGVNAQARNRFEDVEQQQTDTASALRDQFTGEANRGAEVIAAALPRTSSNITLMDEQEKRQGATDFANQQGDALARMRSFSDLFSGLGRDVAQDGSQIGMVGGFKRGSQGVLPFELEAASMKGQGMRTFADILGGLGSVGVNAGLSGGKLFGGASSIPRRTLGPMARAGSTFSGAGGSSSLPSLY